MSGLVEATESVARFLHSDVIPPWMVLEYPAHAAASHVAMTAHGQGRRLRNGVCRRIGLYRLGGRKG